MNFILNQPSTLHAADIVERVFKELNLTNEVTKSFIQFSLANAILFDKKQSDYGSHNISKYGELGVLVRLNDKIERLANLHKSKRKPKNETVLDTYQDVSNYAIIAALLQQKMWPQS